MESERTAQGVVDDWPEVESLEFEFKVDRVKIAFENHDVESLRCPLKEVSRSTKKEPYSVSRKVNHGT